MKTIYIASSWRNAHGVELLTAALRAVGFTVISWVENNFSEDHNHVTKKMDFDTWINSENSYQSFAFDVAGAMGCDVFIYYGPAGMDACAELGVAWREAQIFERENQLLILGLWSKGENIGLMRRMVDCWFSRPSELLEYIKERYSIQTKLF